jgi:hypothetical protein
VTAGPNLEGIAAVEKDQSSGERVEAPESNPRICAVRE